ncbi:uncharacterized protein TNCV_3898681 [Trichonephila clavipes]|nr:uncharacterized protein TNCV_3898681 [Trichonephila clavipes]
MYLAKRELRVFRVSVGDQTRESVELRCSSKEQEVDVLRFTDPCTKFKLPNIELPTCDDNPRDWLNFLTQFEKIHDDVNIDVWVKFHYLIQSIAPRSSPREIVESFPATAENYKKAVEYLKERYGNTSVLIQVYIRYLLQLVMAKNK